MQGSLTYSGRSHIQTNTGQGWGGAKRVGEALNGKRKTVYGDRNKLIGNRKTLMRDGEASECNEKTYKLPSSFGITKVRQRSVNPLTAKLFNWNFYPLEVVSRWRDPQLQVSENYSDLAKWRSTVTGIRECCNFVYNLQVHIVLFMGDMRYNCVVRFSGRYRGGGEIDVSFLWIGVKRFGEIWASLTFLPSSESSSKRYLIAYYFQTCFWKRTA